MPDELVGFLSEVESLDGELTLPKTMADLDEKTITANGTYSASADDLDGYSQVNVNVPNTYTSADEGKVVDNGALVAQGSATYTVNNTYDTTKISSVTVNVSGSGGSGSIVDVTDMPVFTVWFIDDLSDIDSIFGNMTYLECYDYVTGQMVDEGYAAVAILTDVNNDATSYYGCYYHGNIAGALYFVVMDNTEPIGDLIIDNSDTITFNSTSTALGTAGTPTATKGTVSNHSVSVTPSVTNVAGYISSGTKTGTAVTVSASELVSGSQTKTDNGTYDVTNLASLVVAVPSASGVSF